MLKTRKLYQVYCMSHRPTDHASVKSIKLQRYVCVRQSTCAVVYTSNNGLVKQYQVNDSKRRDRPSMMRCRNYVYVSTAVYVRYTAAVFVSVHRWLV